ncbi:MAG: cell division protein FtsZ [Anaerolineaceae bacterium]|nr:cell division protein FtsZ [Anaerolineaceae bacterium]
MNSTIPAQAIQKTPLEAKLPVIKVIGLGGGGSNAINHMIELGLEGVEYIVANTDSQALDHSDADVKIQLGPILTRGLGAGGNPSIGQAAAEESILALRDALEGADMVFLTAGMGGGTGTGSIIVAAQVAKSLGAVTIATVSTPFSFEMGQRQKNAQAGLSKLQPFTDTLITVPNDRLLKVAPEDLTLDLAFRLADDVLRQGIQGITELITQTGLINVNFAHVKHMMQNGGGSFLAIGQGQGEDKAEQAIDQALNHPLLEQIPIESATGIIANFSGGTDLTFLEVSDVLSKLQQRTGNHVDIIPGVISDTRMNGKVQIILVITGIGATSVDAVSSVETAMEEALFAKPEPKKVEIADPAPVQFYEKRMITDMEVSSSNLDLDVPAFMRKRMVRNS